MKNLTFTSFIRNQLTIDPRPEGYGSFRPGHILKCRTVGRRAGVHVTGRFPYRVFSVDISKHTYRHIPWPWTQFLLNRNSSLTVFICKIFNISASTNRRIVILTDFESIFHTEFSETSQNYLCWTNKFDWSRNLLENASLWKGFKLFLEIFMKSQISLKYGERWSPFTLLIGIRILL